MLSRSLGSANGYSVVEEKISAVPICTLQNIYTSPSILNVGSCIVQITIENNSILFCIDDNYGSMIR